MSKLYKTAQGRYLDIEQLRLANEETIAVGNMRVNARGDELGPGGEIIKTRNEVMADYYKLDTPTIRASYPTAVPNETSIHPPPTAPSTPVRGSLAQRVLQKSLDDPEGEN